MCICEEIATQKSLKFTLIHTVCIFDCFYTALVFSTSAKSFNHKDTAYLCPLHVLFVNRYHPMIICDPTGNRKIAEIQVYTLGFHGWPKIVQIQVYTLDIYSFWQWLSYHVFLCRNRYHKITRIYSVIAGLDDSQVGWFQLPPQCFLTHWALPD